MKLENTNEYKVILTVVIGFLLLGVFFTWDFIFPYIAAFGLVTLFSKVARNLFIKLWFLIAIVMGNINKTILLSILFFIIITPISFLFRLFKRESKYLKDKDVVSYYNNRNHLFVKDDLEYPF